MSTSCIVQGGIVSLSGIRFFPSLVYAAVIAVTTSSFVVVLKAMVECVIADLDPRLCLTDVIAFYDVEDSLEQLTSDMLGRDL
jgi:hypothetical protein